MEPDSSSSSTFLRTIINRASDKQAPSQNPHQLLPTINKINSSCSSSSGGKHQLRKPTPRRRHQRVSTKIANRHDMTSNKLPAATAAAAAAKERQDGLFKSAAKLASLTLLAASITLLLVLSRGTNVSANESNHNNNKQPSTEQDTASDGVSSSMSSALEDELNKILQQQQQQQQLGSAQQDSLDSKLLSEAIISRLMLGNISDLDGAPSPQSLVGADTGESLATGVSDAELASGPQAARLRKFLSYLQGHEVSLDGDPNGAQAAFSQFPVLPSTPAATIKRASLKAGNYLRQQQQQAHAGQRQINNYGRVNSFDFGLGKRPDASVSGNILRFGDSASAGGHMAAVSGASGLGKRPSAHRYDFGLGKRVASPAYPRYDFGLGKRAPSRLRYDFGLGK